MDKSLEKKQQKYNQFIRKYKTLTSIFIILICLMLCFLVYLVHDGSSRSACCAPQTCISAPSSIGCDDCRKNGIDGEICSRCDVLHRLTAENKVLSSFEEDYFNTYCLEIRQ